MNENIDVRISNYLTILADRDLCKNFDPAVVRNIETAVAIYAATTSKKYVDDYRRSQAEQTKVDEVNRMLR